MKSHFAIRPLALSALLSLASVGVAGAQTADPSATIAPSKPAAETATPAPSAAVNSMPAKTEMAKPAKKGNARMTPEERAAKKKERMEKYDTNKDGKLDKTERAALREAKGLPPLTDKAKAAPTATP